MTQALNQIELQKLKRELEDLDIDLVEGLHASLVRMRKSERYPFFARLQLSKLSENETFADGPLSVLTIEDVILRGAINLCRMVAANTGELEEIQTILERLLAGDESSVVTETGRPDVPIDQTSRAFPKSNLVPTLSSVEAERVVTAAIQALRKFDDKDRLAGEKVGKYWEREVVSGPFLEELTFRELSEIDPEYLLKKRSFTNAKIYNLDNAVKRFIGGEAPVAPAEPVKATVFEFQSPPPSQSNEQSEPRIELDLLAGVGELPLLQKAVLALIESEVRAHSRDESGLVNLLTKLSESGFSTELSLLLVAREFGADRAAEMLERDNSEFESLVSDLSKRLAELALEYAPELSQHWRSALSSVGCHEEVLAAPYSSQRLDQNLQKGLVRVLIAAFDGKPLSEISTGLGGFFSARPAALTWIFENFENKLPKSSAELREDFELVCPGIPFDALREYMLEHVDYDSTQDLWKKRTSEEVS